MKNTEDNYIIDCENKCGVFKCLTDDEIRLIMEAKLEVSYNEGEVIFKQGTALTHVAYINNGLAKVYLEGVDKKNITLQYVKRGEFVGGPGAFVDNKHHLSVIAVEESEVSLIDVNVFKQLIRQNSGFAMAYIEDISRKGIFNFKKFICLTQKQMYGRVAEALLYLFNDVYPENTSGIPINRKDISELTVLSKDSVGKILASMKESKIIEMSESAMKLIDRKQLEEVCSKG